MITSSSRWKATKTASNSACLAPAVKPTSSALYETPSLG